MLISNDVYHGDCLEIMKQIDDKSIDMILCDLPYGMTACKWDSIISLEDLWAAYKRIIKDNGAIVLTASQPFTSKLVMSNPKWFRCEWIWEKENGTNFFNYKHHPAKVHESILIFSREKTYYEPQMEVGSPYYRLCASIPETIGMKKRVPTENKGDRYPKSVIKINSCMSRPERGLHPTQKPVALFEYFIKTYSKPGDLILDNCAGSGTMAIAAINTERNYILIEKEKKYYDACLARLEKRLVPHEGCEVFREASFRQLSI
jgi:site-specific DNA-methyltransferase (adenine-specific)